MNSTHDLGGMHGFGPIDRSQLENFHTEWEEKVFSLTLACGMLGKWNIDESRFARESMDPGEYLQSSYYEHWLHGLENLLVKKGLVSEQELESGEVKDRAAPVAVPAGKVAGILNTGGPTEMEAESEPIFRTGDTVVVRNSNPRTHTRAPRYIRGRKGTVTAHYGAHIFPDRHSIDGKKVPAHLYSVSFEGNEIWGEDSEPGVVVHVDVFEPYLEKPHG